MPIRIAIPEPTGSDPAYNQRSLPDYLAALQAAGAEPVVVSAHERPDRVAQQLAGVHGILLPGSPHDVDPQRFGEDRIPECADPDPARTAVDELLLQDAFNLHKPILGICFGIQNLNVWRNGSLIQDLKTSVDHEPGSEAVEAHPVRIEPGSILAGILPPSEQGTVQVNSSHHQAVRIPGDNLLISAVSPEDGVIEAVELDSTDHFVVAVQWHPERTYSESAFSRAIFAAFVSAAEKWAPRRIEESVAAQLKP
ncbi:MAG: gamma-glutamyl-gamma-aminobutyrate hydrolase family protein [Terracidiphilus sp.]|jgi:putative glutamine amidotransferase